MAAHAEEETSFFERERDRLIGEITAGFEELLPSTNSLNRKMEEVLGMTREYETVAALWDSFHMLMRRQKEDDGLTGSQNDQPQGMPGTGGHVLKTGTSE